MVVKTISKWSIWLGLIGMSSLLAPPVLADLSDGLVAHYPFDGNAHDVSVNGNHINVYGPVLTVDRTGNVDSAYSFDGIDDFMSAGPIMKELVDFSISVWIKTEQIAASFTLHHDPAIIGTLQGLEDSNDFVLATHNGRLSWYNELGTSSGDAGKYVSDNVWHHVVVVRTNSSVTFHVDGIQTDSFSGGSDAVNSNDIEIGRAYWEGVMYLLWTQNL